MAKYDELWESLQNEEYRRALADDGGTGLAFQIRALREKRGWTQHELAHRLGKRQETVSLWENPDYGNYTYKTLKSLAGAFDLVPVFRLGAFSELVERSANLTPERIAPPSYEDECRNKRHGGWIGAGQASPPGIPISTGISVTVYLTAEPTVTYTVPSNDHTPPAEPATASASATRPTKEPAVALAA